jgi:TolB-like protein
VRTTINMEAPLQSYHTDSEFKLPPPAVDRIKSAAWLALVLISCCLLRDATAQEVSKPTCAVLTLDAKAGIARSDADLLSDRYAIEIERLAHFTRVTRSGIGKTQKASQSNVSDVCFTSESAVEVGKQLKVHYVIYGSIGKVGRMYTINTHLVDVETTATKGSATSDQPGEIEDFLTKSMADNARNLLGVAQPTSAIQEPSKDAALASSAITPAGTSSTDDRSSVRNRRPIVH